jgi:2-polyprenyl-3-methyl-5-hydroxy-6-metoxy-1,4-benzoquinol methylase
VSTSSDARFDRFAAREPYFSILTDPAFLRARLTPEREREFFASGEAVVSWILSVIDAGIAPQFAPMSVLEYGCGIGRLAVPLARRPGSVTAVDRSPAMLDLAKGESSRRGVGHIVFQTPYELGASGRTFDLVICYHVLQRLRRKAALDLMRRLTALIGCDGVGVFQWPYRASEDGLVRATRWLRESVPGVNPLVNVIRRNPAGDPFIPTHTFDLNEGLAVLEDAGARVVQVAFERHSDIDYAIAFVRRERAGRTIARQPASAASEPRERSEPAERRASDGVGESGGRGPRASAASEPRERSEPAERRASERAGESEGRSPSDGIDAYNRAAEAYFSSLSDWNHHLAKPFSQIDETPTLLASVAVLLQALRLAPGMHVLEFGAGSGWLSRILTQMGCRVTLLDVSPTALNMARELYRRQPVIAGPNSERPEPAFLAFDGRRIELPDASVDRIVCFDAFHHAANPRDIVREFGRLLVPGGIAGFVEPGPRHADAPRSHFESQTYGVVERDVDVHDIWRTASASGFGDLRMCVFHVPPHHVSLREYEELLSGGPAQDSWTASTRTFLRHVRSFFLVKGGAAQPDSRSIEGLACDIRLTAPVDVRARKATDVDVLVTNTGAATWLASGTEPGGVALGSHLYDASGALLSFDFQTAPLTNPPRDIAAGEAVSCRLTLPPLEPGRYRIELDCVAAHVAWFAQAGSRPASITIEVSPPPPAAKTRSAC